MTREQVAEKIRWGKIIWLVGVVNPAFMLPQLWQIWATRLTEGISIPTLVILFLVQAGFSAHGYFLRSSALLISNLAAASVTFITATSIIFLRF